MKFCKDCKWIEKTGDTKTAHCLHTTAIRDPGTEKLIWMVVGGKEPKVNNLFCSTFRSGYGKADCGPDAKNFEPKETP